MKKLILLLLLSLPLYSQVIDSDNWAFFQNSLTGKFDQLINKTEYQGKAIGTVLVPIYFSTVDTAEWSFVYSTFTGKFIAVENRNEYYGKESGTVRANLVYDVEPDTVVISQKDTTFIQPDTVYISQTDTLYIAPAEIVFGRSEVDADNGGSVADTLNAEVGTISVINQSTPNNDNFSLTIVNSYATDSSFIQVTMETQNLTQLVTVYVSLRANGGFDVKLRNDSGGTWSDDFKIHFRIYND